MGLYSKKIKDLKDLKDKATIAIPNDPTNEGRALLLLEKQGLITLKKGTDHTASTLDIDKNPKKLKIIEIEDKKFSHGGIYRAKFSHTRREKRSRVFTLIFSSPL